MSARITAERYTSPYARVADPERNGTVRPPDSQYGKLARDWEFRVQKRNSKNVQTSAAGWLLLLLSPPVLPISLDTTIMRGELCIGSASILSLAALLCLIFMHVGQINTSSVPRGISMIKVNVSDYGRGLAGALGDPIEGLYTYNASAPLQERKGLRQVYEFGLYSYCAYVNKTHGTCSNHSTADRFEPYNVITADMFTNYSSLTDALIADSNTTFTDSSYLGEFSNGAYYPLLIGTICAALALFTGILKHPLAFVFSTLAAIIGSLMLLIGATIWTVVIKKAESINNIIVGPAVSPVPLGITVSMGNAIYLAWAAFVTLIVSVMPYMISCCTFRG
ncbi:hypothetical protein AcV7_000344 [Taiwanofungus camphoratus]|nr:hypothetical protein AcV7_000344 [Antrodia cinnamomea]